MINILMITPLAEIIIMYYLKESRIEENLERKLTSVTALIFCVNLVYLALKGIGGLFFNG